MDFFTVDRLDSLEEGKICNLKIFDDISPPFLSSHVQDMFPNGVSAHGERYLLRGDSKTMMANPLIELVFEYVRRSNFMNLPSRFQCLFAVDSLHQAKEFRNRFGLENHHIYKLHSESHFRANMELLTLKRCLPDNTPHKHVSGDSILVTSYLANQYWSGNDGSKKVYWEYFLTCPVTVLERVI